MISDTFGMIKPEGLIYKDDIEARIEALGLDIIRQKEVILTEGQFRSIYGSACKNIPNVYNDMLAYMTTNPVIVLYVRGEDAVKRLLELRGASNPAEALPGTIRGDYAKDQDYRILYTQGKFAKNIFHAADAAEAQEMINVFFR